MSGETPHIEGGLLDADNDNDASIDTDEKELVFVGDPAPVIAAIAQGGGLTESEIKARIPQFLAIAGAIGVAFPPAAPIIAGLSTVLAAVK